MQVPDSFKFEYDLDEQQSIESTNWNSPGETNNLQSLSYLPGKEDFKGVGSQSDQVSSRRVLIRGPSDIISGNKLGLEGDTTDWDVSSRHNAGVLSARRAFGVSPSRKGFQFGLKLQAVDDRSPSPERVGAKSSSELRSKRLLRKMATTTSIVPEEDNISDLLNFITKEVNRQRGNALAFEKVVQERDSDSDSDDSSSEPVGMERNTQLNHLLVEEDHSDAESQNSSEIESAVKSALEVRRKSEPRYVYNRSTSAITGVYREAKLKDVNSKKDLSQIYEKEEGNSFHVSSIHQDSQKNVTIKSRAFCDGQEGSLVLKAKSVTSEVELQGFTSKKSETMNSKKDDISQMENQVPLEKRNLRLLGESGSIDEIRKAHSATSEKGSTNSVKTRKNAKSGEQGLKEFALNSSHRTIKLNEAKGLKQLNSMLILDEDVPKTPESPLGKFLAMKEAKTPIATTEPAIPILRKKPNLPQLHFGGLFQSNIETVYEPQVPSSKPPLKLKIWDSEHECSTPPVMPKQTAEFKMPTTEAADKKEGQPSTQVVASASKDKPHQRKRRGSIQPDNIMQAKIRERLVRGRKDLLFDNLKQNIRNHFQQPNRMKNFEFKRVFIEEEPEERTLLQFNKFQISEFSLEKSRFLQQLTVRILTYDCEMVVYVNPRIMINSLIQLVLHSMVDSVLEKVQLYRQLPELYDLKTADIFDERRPESRMGPLNRRDELVSQLKLAQRVFLVVNKEAFALMNQKRLFNLELLRRQKEIQATLTSQPDQEPTICVALTSSDLGVKKCFLCLKGKDTVASVFQYFKTKYLKRKFSSLSDNDYVFTVEQPLVFEADNVSPLLFESVPVSFSTPIEVLLGRVLKMSKKVYRDEYMDSNSQLSTDQKNRLSCIRNYDKNYSEARRVAGPQDERGGYNSVQAAKLYEVFAGHELDSDHKPLRPLLLGLDFQHGYFLEDLRRPRLPADRVFQPSFKTTCITDYKLLEGQPVIELYIAKDPSQQPELLIFQCNRALQLYHKIDQIMKHVYKRYAAEEMEGTQTIPET